ncbi:MAG TPA: LCP family protein [Actinomycetota bacterium]|nr:LCP family protein [Actinomycetota bacterium]
MTGERVRRATLRRRRRRVRLLSAMAVLAVAGSVAGYVLLAGDGRPGPEEAPPSGAGADAQVVTAFGYDGRRDEVAVLASAGGKDSLVMVVPANLDVSTPGHGTGPVGRAVPGGAETVGTTVANLLGIEVDHRGVLASDGLAGFVEAIGGLAVRLGAAANLGERNAGPGEVELTGAEAAFYLDRSPGDPLERSLRFEEVVAGLVRAAGDGAALQDAAADADGGFGAAVGSVGDDPRIEEVPVVDPTAAATAIDREAADRLVRELFVRPTGTAATVVVLNGNGVPGIGQAVAERIVPEGFRIVVSTNARAFDVETTRIEVGTEGKRELGERIRSLLGVGEVFVGEEATGLADITIVVGRDFRP